MLEHGWGNNNGQKRGLRRTGRLLHSLALGRNDKGRLRVILLIRKKCSVYGAIALGLTVFMGLFLLDTAVGIRYLGIMKHAAGHNLTQDFSRMFRKSGQGQTETLLNIAVFVPFGFFLGEWLASLNRTFGAFLGGVVDL